MKLLLIVLMAGVCYASEDPTRNAIPLRVRGEYDDLKERSGGTTTSSSLFREKATGAIWIGKADVRATGDGRVVKKEETEGAVCREKIASDLYAYYGVVVPETVLSPQLTTNTGFIDGHEAMHIMSKRIEGYHDYKEQEGFVSFKANLDPSNGPMIVHPRGCHKCTKGRGRSDAKGLGRIAAIATWVHDVDFIGGSATNIGYTGDTIILVDPGYSFQDPREVPYPAPRHIQFAAAGRIDDRIVSFETLCPLESLARKDFIETLHDIMRTEERTITQFFTRRNAEYFVSRDPRSAGGLTRQLMERKEALRGHYAAELTPSPVRSLRGRLIYNPPTGERREIPLGDGVDVSENVRLYVGHKTRRIPANEGKVELWITPKRMADGNYLSRLLSSWDHPWGVFWTWGGDDVGVFDYVIKAADLVKDQDLHTKWSGTEANLYANPTFLRHIIETKHLFLSVG